MAKAEMVQRAIVTPDKHFPLHDKAAINVVCKAIEIVKELNCICGCKMELLPCTCDELKGSKEIKAFVQALVGEGLSRSEALGRLVEKYGQDILIKKAV